jgi:hypothetical protein
MTKLIAALALVLTLAGFAGAQTTAKQAKIERLLVLTKANTMVDQVFEQFKNMAASQFPASATPEQRAKMQEAQNKVMDILKARMSWERMRPQYVKLYEDTYTEDEINGILAFYESPAGRAMLDKMPTIISKSMALGQAQMADVLPEIQQVMRDTMGK